MFCKSSHCVTSNCCRLDEEMLLTVLTSECHGIQHNYGSITDD